MREFFSYLLSSNFMAHGYCYRWEPDIIWLHAVSDSIITLSYYLIPVGLLSFVRKRRDVPFHWMFLMFGLFIFGCGTTHLMEVWTIWHGTYRLAGILKAITAGASAVTAVLLIPLIPKAAAIPSPAQLREANLRLEDEIQERRRLERAMLDISAREQRRIGQDLHDDLGQRLTGVAFLARVLQDRLEKSGAAESGEAKQIHDLVCDAISRTRELAHGMAPVITESLGLMTALSQSAEETARTFSIDCRFECENPVAIRNPEFAHHLYYIAQEALNNAIKHAGATSIIMRLTAADHMGCLSIFDNGKGFDTEMMTRSGLGRYTMENRARIVGGTIAIGSAHGKGTAVSCTFPLPRV